MSLDLQKMVWDDPEPRGQSKVVLVRLACYVKKQEFERGGQLLSWPSQSTIAEKCCIPRSSVQRALADLEKLGKIRDTGQRRGRGAVVWEIYPSSAPDVKAGFEYSDLTDSESGDRQSVRWKGASTDLTDSPRDLTDPHDDLTDSESGTGPIVGHEREGKGNEGEGNLREGRARAGARNSVEGEDVSKELAEVEELLAGRPQSKLLALRRDELKDELAAQTEVAA